MSENEYGYSSESSRYYDRRNMDNDFRNASDFACCDDNRIVHRNFADGHFNSGTDVNIYPENFGGLPVHRPVIPVDWSENARDDP